MFTHADGSELLRRHLQRAFATARLSVGLAEFHFHDLRHSGLTQSAFLGATLREVMQLAGHSTVSAAMKYQHLAQDTERERALASRLSDHMQSEEVSTNDT